MIYAYDLEQRTPYQSQRQAPCLPLFHRDASVFVRSGSSATEYQTAHAYRLGAFQLVRERLDALPLQLHNHTDMGASGSGKTTLLNCISTIDTVTSGHITVNNQDITKIKDKDFADFRRENLGFIFQDFNLLDTLTIEENISLSLVINKQNPADIDKRVHAI